MPGQELFLVKILPGVLICESEANQSVIGKYRKAVKGVLLKEEELLSLWLIFVELELHNWVHHGHPCHCSVKL